MKSLWLENEKLPYKENIAIPTGKDEALVRVRLAGICGVVR